MQDEMLHDLGSWHLYLACILSLFSHTADLLCSAPPLHAAPKDSALHTVIHGLAQQLAGMASNMSEEGDNDEDQQAGAHPQQHTSGAALQLYETTMMLFDREGAPEGAVACARAALQHLQPGGLVPSATHNRVSEHAGRLWTNVFAYCCQLGQWQDAYAALISNPLPQTALDCLRHLVTVLTTQGDLLTLCSLPLARVLLLPGTTSASPTAVSLHEEACGALERRAVNAEVSAAPQPYRCGGAGEQEWSCGTATGRMCNAKQAPMHECRRRGS